MIYWIIEVLRNEFTIGLRDQPTTFLDPLVCTCRLTYTTFNSEKITIKY